MRRIKLLLALVVSMIAFGYGLAGSDVARPTCSTYCAGHWCSGYAGACWQLCGTQWKLLDCNQFCGAAC